MTVEKTYQSFLEKLESVYENREAESISRIVFEDAFQINNFQRQDEFSVENIELLKSVEKRLLNREPVQYILGFADFYDLKFKVDQNVLIPRQETEELVFWILKEAQEMQNDKIHLLDIGTGSGCIPIALKSKMLQWEISALDLSLEAISIAKKNALLNNTEVGFFQFDILNETQWEGLKNYDLIVSNPPYIPKKEMNLMPKNVLDFEPHLALFVADEDPILFYKKISKLAFLKLNQGGKLYFETNEFNAKSVLKILDNQGFKNINLKQDMNGKDRMISAIK